MKEEPEIIKQMRQEENIRLFSFSSELEQILPGEANEIMQEEISSSKSKSEDFNLSDENNQDFLKNTDDDKKFILNEISNLVLFLDLKGRIIDINKAGLEFSGFYKEEMIGKYFWSIPGVFSRKNIPKYIKAFKDALAGRETKEFTASLKDKQGNAHIMTFSVFPKKSNGKIKHITVISKDITDIEAIKNHYDMISENTSDLVSIASFSTNPELIYVNSAHKEHLGYDKKDLIGKKFFDLINPEDKKNLTKIVKKYIAVKGKKFLTGKDEKIVEHFEFRVKDKKGDWHYLQSTANIIDEKILTISRDITNKKKSEEELKESEEKYRSLVENIQEGIWQIGMDGCTVFVNEKMTELFGYTKEEMIGKNLFDFMDDKWIKIAKEKLENRKKGEKEIHEFEFLKKNGEKIYCLLRTTPLMEDGKYIGALASLIDITEKKEAEKKNKQSQESYETIFNLSTDAIFVHDYKNGEIIDVNKGVLDKFGYTKEEIKNLNVGDLSVNTAPYTQKEAAEWIKKAMTEGPQKFEWCSKTKNREIIWHENVLQKVNIGGEERILVIGRDITKRKEAEEKIRKSEEKYHELFNNALVGIDIHNSDGSIFAVNKTAERIFGLSEEELKKKNLSFWKGKLIKPDGTEMEAKDFPLSIVAENKKPSEGTIVGLKMSEKDSVRWLLHSARPIIDKNGEIDKVVTSFVEITEHKKTEEKLKETKNHLQTIINNSPSGIITVDNEGIITSWSPSCEQIFGWKKEEVIGKFNPIVPVEMKDFYLESIKKAQNNLEIKPLTKNRGFIDISISKTPLTNKNNEVIGCIGVMTDITEKRKHDEEIRKFKTISDKARYGVSLLKLDGTTVYVNDAFAEMHGYTKEELVGKPHDILHINEEISTIIKDAMEHLKKGEQVFIEETHKKKDGTLIPVQVNASEIPDNDGKPMLISGIVSDLTKQKELTNKLKESENLFRTLIEQSSSGVYIHDPVKNKLFYANPLIREILGIQEEDIEKTDLFKYLNPDDVKLIKERTRKRLAGEKIDPSAEVRIYPPGKKEMWVRLYTTFIKYKGVTAALASVIDITESKEARLKEKERLEELQRYKDATIGREMRVIELKGEINKTCKEQGLAVKYKDTDEKIEEQNSMEATS